RRHRFLVFPLVRLRYFVEKSRPRIECTDVIEPDVMAVELLLRAFRKLRGAIYSELRPCRQSTKAQPVFAAGGWVLAACPCCVSNVVRVACAPALSPALSCAMA